MIHLIYENKNCIEHLNTMNKLEYVVVFFLYWIKRIQSECYESRSKLRRYTFRMKANENVTLNLNKKCPKAFEIYFPTSTKIKRKPTRRKKSDERVSKYSPFWLYISIMKCTYDLCMKISKSITFTHFYEASAFTREWVSRGESNGFFLKIKSATC